MRSIGLGARIFAALLGLALLAGGASIVPSHAQAAQSSLEWRVVPVPALAAPYHLNGIAAPSPSDIWAVGGYTDGGSVSLHYNGSTWQSVAAPGSELLRLASSGSEVWAVGYSGTSPLIVHWTGSQWQPYHFPTPNGSGRIVDIASLPDGSLWAIGDKDVLNYNGHAWKPVRLPFAVGSFSGVAASSPDNVWVVSNDGFHSAISRYDGRHWVRVAADMIGVITDVATTAPVAAWGLHLYAFDAPMGYAGVVHWNGSEWEDTLMNFGDGFMYGIAANTSTDVWAVGSTGDLYRHPDIERWNGSQWVYVPNPRAYEQHPSYLMDVAAVSGQDVWSVGFDLLGDSEHYIEHGLIMRYSESP